MHRIQRRNKRCQPINGHVSFSGDALPRAIAQFRPSVIIGYGTLAQISAYRRGNTDMNQTEIDSGSMSGYRLF
jgi:hypothetical protein